MKLAIWYLLGIFFGWIWAHHEVATECRYQGNFYVGSIVYECRVKND